MTSYKKRQKILRENLQGEEVQAFAEFGIDGMDRANLRYLCGHRGYGGIFLMLPQCNMLIVPPVEVDMAQETVDRSCKVVRAEDPLATVAKVWKEQGLRRLWLNQKQVTVHSMRRLSKLISARRISFLDDPVGRMRQIKDEEEIRSITRAATVTARGFCYILSFLKTGVQERDLAIELDSYMRGQGADGVAFATIVAFGPNTALPHAIPSNRRLKSGDLVLFDFGAVWNGYCSDMTRTVAYGRISTKWQQIYELVLASQEAALAQVQAGVTASSVDRIARASIKKAGYGQAFFHGVGHGVGLRVGEPPYLDVSAAARRQGLTEGMVITVEPGVYLAGKGGVRIEDLVVVQEGGCRVLTKAASKELIIAA